MRDFDIIQATEHRIQACGPSTGHTVKNVAMCDSAALADFLLRGVEAMSSLSAKDEELAKLREENERLREALDECEDYFDNRADADCDQDGFIPNKEMQLLTTVRAALKEQTP